MRAIKTFFGDDQPKSYEQL